MEKISTILLIDDDPVSNFINQRLLKNMQIAHEIKIVNNGKDGINCLMDHWFRTQKSPEVIFLDINMPVMNGFEFLEEFNAMEFNNKDSVLIGILTTSSHPVDQETMKELGAHAFLNKPLTYDKILDFIKLKV